MENILQRDENNYARDNFFQFLFRLIVSTIIKKIIRINVCIMIATVEQYESDLAS